MTTNSFSGCVQFRCVADRALSLAAAAMLWSACATSAPATATSAPATAPAAAATAPVAPATAPVAATTAPVAATKATAETRGPSALTFYWVDVEGGAATIVVTPAGQVILADTGFPGPRDGERVLSVLRDQVHAKAVDYLIVTHYHLDHVGNVPYLAERFPIKAFVDHGASVEVGNDKEYLALAKPRITVRPGDTLPIGGADLTFVSANASVLAAPLAGASTAANPLCRAADPGKKHLEDENSRSLGFVIRQGNFAFADLGDLLWANEHELACPVNLLGQVDLFQVTHHGSDTSNAPQLVQALAPVVAVLDNGPKKGGAPSSYRAVTGAPGTPDVWQLHRALASRPEDNAPEERIANLQGGDDDKAHFIKAVVANGTITITNGRNGHTHSYAIR